MADATHTRPASDAEPSPFTLSGFEHIVSTLRLAVLREEHLDAVAFDEQAYIGGAQDAAVDIWCAAEAATYAFLRAHGGTGPSRTH